jgi:hypothetical protein
MIWLPGMQAVLGIFMPCMRTWLSQLKMPEDQKQIVALGFAQNLYLELDMIKKTNTEHVLELQGMQDLDSSAQIALTSALQKLRVRRSTKSLAWIFLMQFELWRLFVCTAAAISALMKTSCSRDKSVTHADKSIFQSITTFLAQKIPMSDYVCDIGMYSRAHPLKPEPGRQKQAKQTCASVCNFWTLRKMQQQLGGWVFCTA